MKFSRAWRLLRIGPHAYLPRTTSTRAKMMRVQRAGPMSPAKGLLAPPSACPPSAATAGAAIRTMVTSATRALSIIGGPPRSEDRQQTDDDREQRDAFDQRRGDDHRGADLARGLRLTGDRLDSAAADAADAGGTAHDHQAGADGAAQLAGAVRGQEARVARGRLRADTLLGMHRGHRREHRHKANKDHQQRDLGRSLAHLNQSF